MATVLLAGTVVLQGTVIASGDGDHALSSSASTSSPLTGIDLNDTLGLYTLTSASAPFSLTEQTTIIGPTEDVDGNALTWSHQVVSSSGSTHQVQFVAEDGSGNSATLTFTFESAYIPSAAIVTEEFSVSQTSNSFVVTPPVFELPEISSTLAVGAVLEDDNGFNSGSVYIYDVSDLSVPPTKINPPAPTQNSGSSVAMTNSGYLFIGAYGDDTNANNSGAVFVYNLTDLSATPMKLTPSPVGGSVGFSMSATETHLAVSSHNDNTFGTQTGAVYVYDISDLGGTPTMVLPSVPQASRQFGRQLHLDDNNLYVSQKSADVDGYTGSGRVYVYSLSDLSAPPTIITVPTYNLYLGSSITTDENYLYLGAHGYNNNKGGVYVYSLNDLSGDPVTILSPEDLHSGDYLAYAPESMNYSDGLLAVGTHYDKDAATNSYAYQGSVYIYDTSDLSADPIKLTAPDDGDTEFEFFGHTVAVTPQTVVIGAWYDTDKRGTAYVYNRLDLSATPTKLTAFDAASNDRYSWSIAAI